MGEEIKCEICGHIMAIERPQKISPEKWFSRGGFQDQTPQENVEIESKRPYEE